MPLPFYIPPTVRLAVNLVVTFSYWNIKGFCCCDWQSAGLSRRATAWLFIAAAVVFLSQKDLVPSFVDVHEKFQPIFHICAVVVCTHMFYCFLWVEFLAGLSMALCFLDRTVKKIGLGILLDNKLITLRRHGGYINLYTFLAFVLLWLAVLSWYKTVVELEQFCTWASCDLHRVGRSVERQLNHEFDDDCQETEDCEDCQSNIDSNANERQNPRRRS